MPMPTAPSSLARVGAFGAFAADAVASLARPVEARRALAAATLALLLLLRSRWTSPRGAPWVAGWPLLGSLPEIRRGMAEHTIFELFTSWFERHGPTVAYALPGKNMVMTTDPKNIEHMLKGNFENYIKGHIFAEPFSDLLGQGIFNSDGEVWRVQRKTSSRMFTKRQFEDHIWKVVQGNTWKVADILDATEGTFDAFSLFNRFTLDTIGKIGFSQDIGSLEDPSTPFLHSFDRVQQILVLRYYVDPFWKPMRWLGVGFERELKPHLDRLDAYARSIVRDMRARVAKGEDNSFIGLFMREGAAEGQSLGTQDTFMRDMVLNFLIAGRDTTAQCLAWTLFELLQHPPVLARAREEIQSVCGSGPVDFEQLKPLRYMHAVLDEGLRLHPSVPVDGKLCVSRDVLPDGTVVPAGCVVDFCPYAQGRSKAIWGADAYKFRPERWLEMVRRPSSFEFSAFNGGPRECLGKRLAEMEMTSFLATIIRDFDFSLQVHPSAVHYDNQLTLGMSGLPVRARRLARGAKAGRSP